jgi:hypothetical protein
MIRLAVLIPALAAMPLLALAQVVPNPDKGAKGALTETQMKKKLLDGKFLQGTLIEISEAEEKADKEEKKEEKKSEKDKAEKEKPAERIATFKAEYVNKTLNKEAAQTYQKLRNDYIGALRRNDANAAKQIAEQAKGVFAVMYDEEKIPFEFKLRISPNTKVRRKELPPKEPGDDGKPVRYTPKEIAALKTSDGYYKAELSDIELNDTVIQVYLDKAKPKVAPKADPKAKKEKDADKDAEKPEDDPIYEVKLILIMPPPKEVGGNPFVGK